MQPRMIVIDDQERAVVASEQGSLILKTSFLLATVLLDRPERWAAHCGVELPTAGRRIAVRHGRNTWSYLGGEGALIVCGPWESRVRALIRQAAEVGGLIACASVADQWQVMPGSEPRAVEVLSANICNEIPGWTGLAGSRRADLAGQIRSLVQGFLQTSPGTNLPDLAAMPLDSYPGRADVRVDRCPAQGTSFRSEDIERFLEGAPGPHVEALDYWWQSVFTMWWKGFW